MLAVTSSTHVANFEVALDRVVTASAAVLREPAFQCSKQQTDVHCEVSAKLDPAEYDWIWKRVINELLGSTLRMPDDLLTGFDIQPRSFRPFVNGTTIRISLIRSAIAWIAISKPTGEVVQILAEQKPLRQGDNLVEWPLQLRDDTLLEAGPYSIDVQLQSTTRDVRYSYEIALAYEVPNGQRLRPLLSTLPDRPLVPDFRDEKEFSLEYASTLRYGAIGLLAGLVAGGTVGVLARNNIDDGATRNGWWAGGGTALFFTAFGLWKDVEASGWRVTRVSNAPKNDAIRAELERRNAEIRASNQSYREAVFASIVRIREGED